MRSFYLLAYDIADDRRRVKIARWMESLGGRVQGSVFEAYLDPAELDKVLKRSLKLMKTEEDSLRIYFLCESCRTRLKVLGRGKTNPPPAALIV